MTRNVTVMLWILAIGVAVAGCASHGNYGYQDRPSPYGTGGGSGGGCH